MSKGEYTIYAHPSFLWRRIVGSVKAGDMISIKNPEKHSLVKAGKLRLKSPDCVSMIVPSGLSKTDVKLLQSLADWGIIVVNEESVCQTNIEDPLISELQKEYSNLNVKQAVKFIKSLGDSNKEKLIQFEMDTKNRVSVLNAFRLRSGV